MDTVQSPQRRSLVLTGLASATAAVLAPMIQGCTTAPGITLDEFIALSSQLTQRPANNLDRGMAQRIFTAFLEQDKHSELASLFQDPSTHAELATDLRTAWFSGLVPGQTAPVGYEHALLWSAAAFLHTPGTCGGPTGYWSQPPASHT